MIRKSQPFLEVKADENQSGVIKGFVSVYNTEDLENDVIYFGAFSESIKTRKPVGLWCHKSDQPVAKTTLVREVPAGDPSLPDGIKSWGGLYIEGEFNLDTQVGREAYSNVKNGLFSEFSIGFSMDDWTVNKRGGRDIKKGTLYEWSIVMAGMNPHTSLTSIKSSDPTTESESGALDKAVEQPQEQVRYTSLKDIAERFNFSLLEKVSAPLAIEIKNMFESAGKRSILSVLDVMSYYLYDFIWDKLYWSEEEGGAGISACIDEYAEALRGLVLALYSVTESMSEEDKSEMAEMSVRMNGSDEGQHYFSVRMKSEVERLKAEKAARAAKAERLQRLSKIVNKEA